MVTQPVHGVGKGEGSVRHRLIWLLSDMQVPIYAPAAPLPPVGPGLR